MKMTRTIYLLGAPTEGELLEDESASVGILPAFRRLYREDWDDNNGDEEANITDTPTTTVAWRRVPPAPKLTVEYQPDSSNGFFAFSPNGEADADITAEYLDSTYTQYLSQKVEDIPDSSGNQSIASIESSNSSDVEDRSFVAGGINVKQLEKLKIVPTAKKLEALYPQTVSICAVVAVLSVDGPRTVTTRYGNEMEILNLTVGDDTRSGFGITFWLSPPHKPNTTTTPRRRLRPVSEAARKLRETALDIRPQDIVYMGNIALTVFKDSVYGSSMLRDLTKVHILHRTRRIDRSDERFRLDRLHDDSLAKAASAVLRWCLDFVGWEGRHPDDLRQKKRQKLDSNASSSRPDQSSGESSWAPSDTQSSSLADMTR